MKYYINWNENEIKGLLKNLLNSTKRFPEVCKVLFPLRLPFEQHFYLALHSMDTLNA